MSAKHEALPMPEHVAEVMPGWCLCWAGFEPLAHLLARHPSVRIGTKLYAAAELRRLQALNAQMLEALSPFANLGEYRELREAFAACVRPHERDGLLKAFADARAAIAAAKEQA